MNEELTPRYSADPAWTLTERWSPKAYHALVEIGYSATIADTITTQVEIVSKMIKEHSDTTVKVKWYGKY